METRAHAQLKRLAVAWLVRHGCDAAASEVRSSGGPWVADAAGYLDRLPIGGGHDHAREVCEGQAGLPFAGARRERCEPRTIIVECKRSRADFLRDGRDLDRLLALRARLVARRASAERAMVARGAAVGRSDGYLFGGVRGEDFARGGVPAEHRRLLARAERVETALHGGTKFLRASRYRVADYLYLLAPRGLVSVRELPEGWGLLECSARWGAFERRGISGLASAGVTVRKPAPALDASARRRAALLRNIAAAATRDLVRGVVA